jgi:acyl-CoA reductase-like NAD-dependent aldehyde dehydrogenase
VANLDPDLRALQEVRDFVERAHAAHAAVAGWSQERIDRLCEAMAKAAAAAAYDLARVAVEETGIGRVHYKVLKNLFGAEGTWASIKHEKTVGIIQKDEQAGVYEVATPAGVIACIVPTTNPTSTAIFKAMISVKGRNACVISPHPRARRCIGETVEVMRRAIERAGGPADLVLSLSNPTIESTGALMKHRKTAMILATGGTGLVHAAYSSGKPAYGVGPGNVPVYVDRSADVTEAARWIVASQSFDNATLCCSEQGLVLDRPIADRMLDEMRRRGAYLCDEAETDQLARLCNRRGHMNPDVVGLDPWKIAEMAGFHVPRSTSVLLAPQGGVAPEWPLAIEILCPLLSVHVVDGWEEGCEVSLATLRYEGLGHTIGLWARDQAVLDAWFLEKPANRIVVNGPTSEGAVGYSTNLMPSMSLGCGPQAGNITSDNITAKHLINVKRVAFRRRDWESIYARDHARAAALTGDHAPRGSGLPGDPALAAGSAGIGRAGATSSAAAADPAPASNWRGNPAVGERASAAPARSAMPATGSGGALATKVQAGVKSLPASFTRPGAAPPRPAAPAPRAAPATPAPIERSAPYGVPGGSSGGSSLGTSASAAGAYVGAALSIPEIQGILQNAGAGCPLGPCKGCPHHHVQTGACTA